MDPSFSDINEVYYDGPLADDTQKVNDPLSPNYYQDHPYQQNSFTYMNEQQSSRKHYIDYFLFLLQIISGMNIKSNVK